MSRKHRKNKTEEMNRRYEAIKSLMSTFAMSAVAVVAVVTLVPASPKAEITKAIALSDQIAYQVNVTDADQALYLDSLFVVLENQLEYYEQPISLGETSGYFNDLKPNTDYYLRVYGNKGFGQERLDSLSITTEETEGVFILSVDPEVGEFDTTYLVNLYINDVQQTYTSIDLYYGYAFEPDVPFDYTQINLTPNMNQIVISDVYTEEPFHIYIEGTTQDGSEILDEIWVTPPYNFYGEAYVDSIHNNYIKFSTYYDQSLDHDIDFKANIFINDRLLRTEEIETMPGDFHGEFFSIEDLLENTNYRIEIYAIYTNPQTLRLEESLIFDQEVSTLGDYAYTYNIEHFDTYDEITINLSDPNDYYQYAYYTLFDISGEFNQEINYETYYFQNINGQKRVSFVINIPTDYTYLINIGISSDQDFQINELIYSNSNE